MLAEIVITPWHWVGFILLICLFLALDLGVFNRKAKAIGFKEALGWTTLWFATALTFAGLLFTFHSKEKAALFFTGYVVEFSLSMDNVFVMAVIFRYFQVQSALQHRVLFWGILGALVMRGTLIFLGAELIAQFGWLLYALGGFLIFTGIKMIFSDSDGVEPEKNPLVKLARRFFRVSPDFDRDHFTTRWEGRLALTPLAIVLVMIETTDLVFALDSIPAIFGITQDSFIIFTSNIFAILGLRSLYFVLAEIIDYFTYLKYGLSIVLVFIGGKMVAKYWHLEIPDVLALSIVGGIILGSVVISVVASRFQGPKAPK